MQFLKFSFILIFFNLNSLAFDGNDCFKSTFNVEVKHKSFPFGLLERVIKVEKESCEIKISHEKYKYLKNSWTVDICRDPIHIKNTYGSVTVHRKNGFCDTVNNAFCKEYKSVKKLMEDDGLIFAEGVKSDINSDHGKIYCGYVLLNEYLNKGIVFDMRGVYGHLFKPVGEKAEVKTESGLVIDPNSGKADF